jgi:hypothetical protein
MDRPNPCHFPLGARIRIYPEKPPVLLKDLPLEGVASVGRQALYVAPNWQCVGFAPETPTTKDPNDAFKDPSKYLHVTHRNDGVFVVGIDPQYHQSKPSEGAEPADMIRVECEERHIPPLGR